MTPLGAVLLIIVLMLLFGFLPQTGFHTYGYYPSSILTIILVILLILLLLGRI